MASRRESGAPMGAPPVLSGLAEAQSPVVTILASTLPGANRARIWASSHICHCWKEPHGWLRLGAVGAIREQDMNTGPQVDMLSEVG